MQSLQIIKKRVNLPRLYGSKGDEHYYYNSIKYGIKQQIKDADKLLIELIPNTPITTKCELEILIHLQLEFTPSVIIPPSDITLSAEDISGFSKFFGAKEFIQGVTSSP